MTSRDRILAAVQANQPELRILPQLDSFIQVQQNPLVAQFTTVLTGIGGKVTEVANIDEIILAIKDQYALAQIRVISNLPSMQEIANDYIEEHKPHDLQNVELAILSAHFAVAENGACWLTESLLPDRVLPFITQHLILIVNKNDILPTLHEAYQKNWASTIWLRCIRSWSLKNCRY